MSNFKVISTKYFNQLRNGFDYSLNTSEFTTTLKANAGEKIKLTEVIELGVIINESKSLPILFDSSEDSLISNFTDWTAKGLYAGVDIQISFDGTDIAATVESITGDTNEKLIVDSTAATALTNTRGFTGGVSRDDVVIIITTAPTNLEYKFGIIPNSQGTNSYKSDLDKQEQVYYAKGISTSNVDMNWLGGKESTNTGTVTIKFVSTRNDYVHKFELNHIFVVPYYTPQILSSILNNKNPSYLGRGKSLKYCNGFFFSGDRNSTKSTFEDNGRDGSVGFYDENFSGFKLNYGIEDYAVSNSLNTGVIEVTVANTVTFKMTSSTATGFVGSEEIILYHSKLPEAVEFENKTDSYDTVFMRDQIAQTEGAAAVASGMWSAVTVTLSGGKLEVSAVITYTTDQKLLLGKSKYVLLSANIATEDKNQPDNVDRANMKLAAANVSSDDDVRGVVSGWQPSIYKPSEFNAGTAYTDFKGWDGDIVGQTFTFDVNMTYSPLITGAEFSLVLDNGTDYWKIPNTTRSFPITSVVTTSLYGYDFQVLTLNNTNDLNLDPSLLLNKVILSSIIPTSTTSTQTWVGSVGFRVPWREWIQNLNVPTSFIDYAQTNNNQNNKSSNYSGVSSYEVKTLVRLQVQTPGDQVSLTTFYECFSDASAISDYDTDPTAGFTADIKVYDPAGEIVTDEVLSNQQCKIVAEFVHTSGIITLANIEGYISINTATGTEQQWSLHSDVDMTGANNPLQPSDTLTTNNNQFVEVISTNNLVQLICYTNQSNISEDIDYKLYARLDSI